MSVVVCMGNGVDPPRGVQLCTSQLLSRRPTAKTTRRCAYRAYRTLKYMCSLRTRRNNPWQWRPDADR